MVGGLGRFGKTNLRVVTCRIQTLRTKKGGWRLFGARVRREDHVRGDSHGHSTRVHT